MKFKKTLTGIVISLSLCSSINAENNISYEDKNNYEKREENPIYPISAMIGSLTVSAGAAYYALREARKNKR